MKEKHDDMGIVLLSLRFKQVKVNVQYIVHRTYDKIIGICRHICTPSIKSYNFHCNGKVEPFWSPLCALPSTSIMSGLVSGI